MPIKRALSTGWIINMVAGAIFIAFFSCVNMFLWGDWGDVVHLMGVSVPAYSLVWLWITSILIIYSANYAVDGHPRNPICHIIAAWWTANIGMTTLLNYINPRGIEQAGEPFLGLQGLVLDFTAQGLLDLASIFIIWFLVKRGIIGVSIWTLCFCGFLVANLYGHTHGAFKLMLMVNPEVIAQSYDAWMYLVFTIMLLIQVIGSGGDVLLRWIGANVDLYADLRGPLHRLINRDMHLF